MGRKGEVCGAVSGGIMVLGIRYGRGEKDDRKAMELTYKKTGELIDRFIKKHDSVICKRLLNGCELTTKEGQKLFRDRDLLNKVCKPCIQSVVEIVKEL